MMRAARHTDGLARWLAGGGLALCASLALAADEPSLYSPRYLLQVLGSLLLVLACLLGVLYLLKRFQGGAIAGRSPLHTIASLKVGTREKLVLVRAGEQQLLLGVAPGSVRTLHVFGRDATVDTGDFGALLAGDSATGRGK